MKRKEYLKPEMKVFQLKSRTQLLAGSGPSLGIHRRGSDSDPLIEDEDEIL